MKSPLVHEFCTSYGANLFDGRGYAEGSYIFRQDRQPDRGLRGPDDRHDGRRRGLA